MKKEDILFEYNNILEAVKNIESEDGEYHLAQKKLDEIKNSLETFWFLLYGSFLGLGINLIASILHETFYKYGITYVLGVVSFSCFSLAMLINFIVRKWDRIKKDSLLIKNISESSFHDEKLNRIKDIKKRLENLEKNITWS